jgi:hypothetical protein
MKTKYSLESTRGSQSREGLLCTAVLRFLPCAALLLAASCSTSGSRGEGGGPARPVLAANLPPERYLSAVGVGDTAAGAEKAAAAELAKIFESRIRVEDVLVERYTELMSGKSGTISGRTDGFRDTSVTSAQTLYNIKYTPAVTDSKGLVTVVAYMDRRETAAVYMDKIRANSARVKFLAAEAGKAAEPVGKFAMLDAAAAIGINNRVLVDQLSTISQAARGAVDLGYDQDALQKEAAAAAKAVGFAVRINGDRDGMVAKMCEETLTDMGFTVSGTPALAVEGVFAIEGAEVGRSDMKFVRYDLSLSVRDSAGAAFVTLVEKGREGHVSASEAAARALRTVRERLQPELRRKLTGFFDGLTRRGS